MDRIFRLLFAKKFSLSSEKILQQEIYDMLKEFVNVEREFRLDSKNIIDFFYKGSIIDECIGIEVKINGNRKEIFKQCQRYCEFDQIKGLILVTNRSIGFPEFINNKPCKVINLGVGWL